MKNQFSKYFRTYILLDFINPMQEVIAWNKIARNGKEERTIETLTLQSQLVDEEAEELLKAISENDEIEFLDAWCDLFVVLSYYVYLKEITPLDLENLFKKYETTYLSYCYNDTLEDLVLDIKEYKDEESLIYVCRALLDYKGKGFEALLEVLKSNNSKFPLVKNYPQSSHQVEECKRIEVNSKGRYKNVSCKVINNRICFFDSNNKIMKPSTFVEPNLIPYIQKEEV